MHDFENLISCFPDAAFVCALENAQILCANIAAERAYDRTQEELRALTLADLGEHGQPLPLRQWETLARAASEPLRVWQVHRLGERTGTVEVHASLLSHAGQDCWVFVCRADNSKTAEASGDASEAEARFRTVFQFSQHPIALVDLRLGVLREVNGAMCRTLGFSLAELSGRPLIELVHPDDWEPTSEVIRRMVELRENVTAFVNRYRHKDGSYRTFSWNACHFLDSDLVLGIVEDITAQREGTLALRQSEDRFRRLVEFSPVAMVVIRPDNTFQTMNRRFVQNFGYTIEDIPDVPTWWRTAYPDPAYRAAAEVKWKEALQILEEDPSAIIQEQSFRIRVKDGRDRFVQFEVSRIDQTTIVSLLDVTEKIRTERTLTETARRLSFHIENTPLAVIEWDLNLCVSAWNAGAETVFGYNQEEAMGQHAMLILPESARVHVDSTWKTLVQTGRANSSINENVTKDGRRILCEWTNTPLLDSMGQVMGVASLARDITLQRDRERALVEAKEAAERANHAKSEFLSMMSHELRTPLNVLIAPCELLEAELQESEALEMVRLMRSSAEHLLGLINDILDLAKIESGRMEPHFESIELGAFLLERMRPLAASAEQKGLGFSIEIAEECAGAFQTDPRFLLQLLINLVGNAIKFTARGSVALQVRSGRADTVEIEVRDTGPGIPPSQQRMVFEPFQQVDMSINRPYQGTGLGLSICRRIVDKLQGRILLRSSVGDGCTFTVVLPRIREAESGTVSLGGTPSAQREPYRGCHVLVVEDDPGSQVVAPTLLRKLGCTAEVAETGELALEMFQRTPFQAVLLDIRLPGIDGRQTADRIRQLPGGDGVFIVAQTAYALSEQREEIMRHAFDTYLTKPLTLAALREAMALMKPRVAQETR